MAVIQGSKVVFQALIGDEYLTILCAKSITLRTEAEIVETTTKGDGRFKDFDYDQLSAQITLDAAHFIRNEERTPPVMFDLADMQYQFEELNFRIIYTDSADASRIHVFRGQGIVRATNTNASAGLVVDGTADILVKGQWFIEDAVPEFVNLRMECYNNDAAACQVRVRLFDADGNFIFDTQQIEEAINGWLENPFDITKKVLVGDYYMLLEVRTETENNTFLLTTPPVGITGTFDDGITEIDTQAEGKPIIPFDIDKHLIIALGNVVEPPPCVAPVLAGSLSLPDGAQGIPYSHSIPITGSAPFNLSNITKPSWMTIEVAETSPSAYALVFGGTPDDESQGTDIDVTVDVGNACGAHSFSDTIDVTAPPVEQSNINWLAERTGIGAAGTFRIYVNGVLTETRTSTLVDANGNFLANPGDTITVQVSPAADVYGSLSVAGTSEGLLYQQLEVLAEFQQYTWVVQNGSQYDAIAEFNKPI